LGLDHFLKLLYLNIPEKRRQFGAHIMVTVMGKKEGSLGWLPRGGSTLQDLRQMRALKGTEAAEPCSRLLLKPPLPVHTHRMVPEAGTTPAE
jgi:hypothetical protein